MRRILGLVLVALGVALIALAVAMPTYVYPRVAKVPQDADTYIVAQGEGATVLLAQSTADGGIRELTDQTVTVTREVRGQVLPNAPHPSDKEAFYRLAFRKTVPGQTNGLVEAYTEGGSINGTTGLADNCCGDYLNTGTPNTTGLGNSLQHQGLLWKFPFKTHKHSYPFWDVNIKHATTARFDGTEKLDGMLTYRFVQPIPAVAIAQQVVPGSLLGLSAASVSADQVYSDTRTLWVEPRTGAIIKGSEQVNEQLSADGKQVPVLQGTITYTDATVAALVHKYKGNAASLKFVSSTGLIIGYVLGALLLVLGLVLLAGSRRRPSSESFEASEPADDSNQPVDDASSAPDDRGHVLDLRDRTDQPDGNPTRGRRARR